MNALLEQFLPEARDCLQLISTNLMQLEQAPDDLELLNNLFRQVHTLKGNSGLFDFPEMTQVLSAGEDLMDAVRNGQVAYSSDLADQLLTAMDFVGLLCDEIEITDRIDASRENDSLRFATALRAFIGSHRVPNALHAEGLLLSREQCETMTIIDAKIETENLSLDDIPEEIRLVAYAAVMAGRPLHWLVLQPDVTSFLHGDDPFFTARHTPGLLWGRILSREVWPKIAELNVHRCTLAFQLLSDATPESLTAYFRLVAEQVTWAEVDVRHLLAAQDPQKDAPVFAKLVAQTLTPQGMNELTAPPEAEPTKTQQQQMSFLPPSAPGLISPIYEYLSPIANIFESQRQILMLDDSEAWQAGRVKAVAKVLTNCSRASGDNSAREEIEVALALSLAAGSNAALLDWLATRLKPIPIVLSQPLAIHQTAVDTVHNERSTKQVLMQGFMLPVQGGQDAEESVQFTRSLDSGNATTSYRPFDESSQKILRVEQGKIDLLMNLIGEMVVSKNALPYLAQRAEEQFGVRELASQIKDQYAVISRIAEEMQSAIMQVRMMPVSTIFQPFPRLVRDLSHQLGKQVQLVLEGEETEADKNIIESLADPIMHIVRNSLDHGLESPDVRRVAGKLAMGTLTIRSAPEAGQILIEISDDGKGLDPNNIKHKAFEKGLINAATLDRISDAEAINLVFIAGFSTAEVVSDLSGRGVGLDVVKTAVEKVKGSIALESVVGQGTRIRIILPLSMALTKVMIVVSDGQLFGVPIESVVATLRVPFSAIRNIKQRQTVVRRGVILILKSLNTLLGIAAKPRANADNEMAVLVVRVGAESVGLIVDEFHETLDVIQKPLNGVLAGLYAYSGSALLGNGSVLMVLDVKEIV